MKLLSMTYLFGLVLVGTAVLEEYGVEFKVLGNVDVRIFWTDAMSVLTIDSLFPSFAFNVYSSNILGNG